MCCVWLLAFTGRLKTKRDRVVIEMVRKGLINVVVLVQGKGKAGELIKGRGVHVRASRYPDRDADVGGPLLRV